MIRLCSIFEIIDLYILIEHVHTRLGKPSEMDAVLLRRTNGFGPAGMGPGQSLSSL